MLRYLDLLLTDEMRDAGAVSLDELTEMADRPFHGGASRETIEEWWEFTRRRGWLEEHEAGRWRPSGSVARRSRALLHAARTEAELQIVGFSSHQVVQRRRRESLQRT